MKVRNGPDKSMPRSYRRNSRRTNKAKLLRTLPAFGLRSTVQLSQSLVLQPRLLTAKRIWFFQHDRKARHESCPAPLEPQITQHPLARRVARSPITPVPVRTRDSDHSFSHLAHFSSHISLGHLSPTSTMSISLASLPPKTLKTYICPLAAVWRGQAHLSTGTPGWKARGRPRYQAYVACVCRPVPSLHVRGWDIIVFWNHANLGGAGNGDEDWPGAVIIACLSLTPLCRAVETELYL